MSGWRGAAVIGPPNIGWVTRDGTLQRYRVSWRRWPKKLAAGPGGAMWFTTDAPTLGHVTADGHVGFTALPALGPGGRTTAIARAPDGGVWFLAQADSRSSSSSALRLGRIDPGRQLSLTTIPGVQGTDAVSASPNGTVWISGTAASRGALVVRSPAGAIRVVRLPRFIMMTSMTAGADGNAWYSGFAERDGTNRIWRVTPEGRRTSFVVGRGGVWPSGIAGTSDRSLGFVDLIGGFIGRVAPTGGVTLYPPTAVPRGVRLLHGSVMSVLLSCPANASGPCHGAAAVRFVTDWMSHDRVTGRVVVRLTPGRSATVRIRLGPGARRALVTDGHLVGEVQVTGSRVQGAGIQRLSFSFGSRRHHDPLPVIASGLTVE